MNWNILLVYIDSSEYVMRDQLDFLSSYWTNLNDPTFCAKDFNAILNSNEYIGGNSCVDPKSHIFRQFINRINFMDLDFNF